MTEDEKLLYKEPDELTKEELDRLDELIRRKLGINKERTRDDPGLRYNPGQDSEKIWKHNGCGTPLWRVNGCHLQGH